MQKRHTDRDCYFKEQAHTTEKYYIPYIYNNIGIIPGKILEVGCGEGGNLLPFAKLDCEVVGIDMAESRIKQAKSFFNEENHKGTFIASDIFKLDNYFHQFPLVIVHDVIEHINNKKQLLLYLQNFLTPQGFIFIAFPAWQMPFGGHQQIARGKVMSHLPFTHLLPKHLYKLILKMFGEKEDTIEELLSIKSTRCPIESFLEIANQTNYKVVNQQLYFINPHYETKFGLAPRKLNRTISQIPYIRNFFSTSCFYILKVDENKN